MDPLTLALIGMGAGIIQGMDEKQKSKENRNLVAAQAKTSAFTGQAPQWGMLSNPSMMAPILQGGLQGAAMGQSFDRYGQDKALQQSQIDLNRARLENPQLYGGGAYGAQYQPAGFQQWDPTLGQPR